MHCKVKGGCLESAAKPTAVRPMFNMPPTPLTSLPPCPLAAEAGRGARGGGAAVEMHDIIFCSVQLFQSGLLHVPCKLSQSLKGDDGKIGGTSWFDEQASGHSGIHERGANRRQGVQRKLGAQGGLLSGRKNRSTGRLQGLAAGLAAEHDSGRGNRRNGKRGQIERRGRGAGRTCRPCCAAVQAAASDATASP